MPGGSSQKTFNMNDPNSNTNPRYPLRSASTTTSPPGPPRSQPQPPPQTPSWNAINNPYTEQWAQYYARLAAYNQHAAQTQHAAQGYSWQQPGTFFHQQQQQQYNGYLNGSYYGQAASSFAYLGISSSRASSFAQPYLQYSSQQGLPTQMQYDSLGRARAYKAKSFRANKRNRPNPNTFEPSQAMMPPQSSDDELERMEKALEATELSPKKRKGAQRDNKIMLPAPHPTLEYLAQAAEEPFVIDPPERLLVILDLNGTLIYRPNRNQPTHLVARPFLKPFLRYLFENYSVIVWSSARYENVNVIVERVLDQDLRSMLLACLARESFNLSPGHYNQNVQVYKDLDIIWKKEEIQQQIPGYQYGKRFDQHNTVLIDDTILKASAQPHNLLQVPEFAGTKADMESDVLREVAGYLEVLKMQWDVSKFMRKEPFEADGRWQYDWEDDIAPGGELEQQVSAIN